MPCRISHRFVAMVLVVAAALAACGRLHAKNVDLSTVPKRESVQLTIYNSEDLTLVRETRIVSFKKGENGLQFSWANTLIDPTSVRLRFLGHADRLDLLDTTFPHDKPKMLYWNVQSELDGEATVEISYFTSGISWSADYVAIANQDETQMGFEGFVRVSNNSGEQYEDAEVRLVVGKINLVEKIAQLTQLPANRGESSDRLRRKAGKDQLADMDQKWGMMSGMGGGFGGGKPADGKPKQIIKEGLSEYFIYSIEGTETIPNGWTKRMRSFEG